MSFLRPSFFIIGERKCGTSSLFRYLLEHPQVLPGERKEMQFFTQDPAHVAEHFDEYLRRFPTREESTPTILRWPELNDEGILFEEEIEYQREPGIPYITGEASADTFADVAPDLLRRHLPELRLIVLLRDPVARAFSHHRMLQRFQDEGRDLPRPIGSFAEDMRAEVSAASAGLSTKTSPLLALGCYVESLQAWTKEWGSDALLILFTEDLQDATAQPALFARVAEHLRLSSWPSQRSSLPRYNEAPAATLPVDIQSELETFYRPYNARLRDFLQCALPWEAKR